ncbi:MAG TPA: ABC transporter ATP-binding protein [Bacillota bacterium]|nr:ABC transporter ATP-binding protein [Bacillota bacterium]
MEAVLAVQGLCKSYGGKQAVNNLNLQVQRREIFGLLGANGAGKSTSIECILNTKKYDRGDVRILGMNPRTERKAIFERVGVQFQEPRCQDKITVEEICEVTRSFYKNPADYKELLKSFGLSDKCRQMVPELSGGERQRLFVVLALIPDPELVFLDELTSGLDTKARRDVWKHLEKLKAKGLTIFLTSHYMDEVEALCDRILILKNGETLFQGTVADAVSQSPHDKLEDAYLWFTGEEDENESL